MTKQADVISRQMNECYRTVFGEDVVEVILYGSYARGDYTADSDIDMAADKLKSAKILLDERQYKDSIGRSYYAIFSSLRAVLAIEEKDFSKHSAVIAYFQKECIKTGKFHIKYSKYIQQAFQIRNSCDYDDFYIASKEEAEEQYNRA